ncbi:hypothetical protein IWQ62_005723 [Dispira parvispora]|uniref:Uncharacterized protein n=1 Tax=Dispira parvispora TaxID=1520584 RepID=A0A9W8AJF8_9FUNG|nr:hypothetical protein IWQ62_005723 [Dispira parvispora]
MQRTTDSHNSPFAFQGRGHYGRGRATRRPFDQERISNFTEPFQTTTPPTARQSNIAYNSNGHQRNKPGPSTRSRGRSSWRGRFSSTKPDYGPPLVTGPDRPSTSRPTRGLDKGASRGDSSDLTESIEARFRQLSLISRLDSTQDLVESLTQKDIQDEYFVHLGNKVTEYRQKYGDEDCPAPTNPNAASRTPQRSLLEDLVGCFRKLREGLTSSRRVDALTIRAYEQSMEICILAHSDGELLKTVRQLLEYLYPTCRQDHPILDLSRRPEMWVYYQLFLVGQKVKRLDAADWRIASTKTTMARTSPKLLDLHATVMISYLALKRGNEDGSLPADDPYVIFLSGCLSILRSDHLLCRLATLTPCNSYVQALFAPILRWCRAQVLATISRAYYSLPLAQVYHILGEPRSDELSGLLQRTETPLWSETLERDDKSQQILLPDKAGGTSDHMVWFRKPPVRK